MGTSHLGEASSQSQYLHILSDSQYRVPLISGTALDLNCRLSTQTTRPWLLSGPLCGTGVCRQSSPPGPCLPAPLYVTKRVLGDGGWETVPILSVPPTPGSVALVWKEPCSQAFTWKEKGNVLPEADFWNRGRDHQTVGSCSMEPVA